MPTLDTTASAAVAGDFAPAYFIYSNVSGDPVRITTCGKDITFASTGDADLDGFTFTSFDHRAIQVGDVANSESGSDTLTVDLSGIVTIDTTLLNEIGNIALWQGRSCRIWTAIYDASGVTQQGAIVPFYTGYMSSVSIMPSPKTQTIRLNVENYLAAFNAPSNRSYLNQSQYDAADTSAQASISAANVARQIGNTSGGDSSGGGNGGTMPGYGGAGSGGGGWRTSYQ